MKGETSEKDIVLSKSARSRSATRQRQASGEVCGDILHTSPVYGLARWILASWYSLPSRGYLAS